MRIQLNKYLRELPEAFGKRNRKREMKFNLCPACQTELYYSWELPVKYADTDDFLFCDFEYAGKKYMLDYKRVRDSEWCRRVPEREKNIPEAELQKQLALLQEIRTEEDQALLEKAQFDRENKDQSICPICHSPLKAYVYYTHEASFRYQINKGRISQEDYDEFCVRYADKMEQKKGYWGTEEINFDFLNFLLRRQDEANAEKKFNALCSRVDSFVPSGVISDAGIKDDRESLKKYIFNLFTLETDIYSVGKRLLELYTVQAEYDRSVYRRRVVIENEIRNQAADGQALYESRVADLERIQSAGQERVYVARPQEPRKPHAPVLEKSGLFNKKKVLARNAELTAEYEKACQQYESELAAYRTELDACTAKEAQRMQEAGIKYRQAISEAEAEVEKARVQMEQSAADAEARIQEACALPPPETAAKQMLDDEIAQAEKLLKSLVECRNKLYACNVVFIKYRNMVALATFYEYLIAGRCASLEGANGAYNIFEAECRANQIIGQLTKIVDSLEKIKESQYLIYSQLRSINSSLDVMNSTMRDVAKSMESIRTDVHDASGYMEKVAGNSDVIAHNTAVTAYYSKINAELTDSLGYLAALH